MKLVARIVAILCLALPMAAQQAPLDALPAGQLLPKITFTRNWPDAKPQFFSIEAESSGRAEYRSQSGQGDEQPYILKFTMTDPDRTRIFQLAEEANYLKAVGDSGKKMAQTGIKTLAYKDSTHNSQMTFNWSSNKSVEELTSIFIGISSTIEAGRKLDDVMQHDKLGLYQQLDAMKQAADAGDLEQIQILAPTLEKIASDSTYMHIAQQRARELLKLAKREAPSKSATSAQ